MLRPLDLQAIYMNLDKVGKEHSLTRAHVTNQQALEAQKLAKIHELEQNAVNQTEASEESGGDGSKVKTHEEGSGQPGGHHSQSERRDPGETEPKPEETTWKDPKLGHHIDLTG